MAPLIGLYSGMMGTSDGFSTYMEMLEFVRDQYLSDARHGEPFLLAVRLIERHLVRCGGQGSDHSMHLVCSLWAGVFAKEGTLISCDAPSGCPEFVFKTQYAAEAPGIPTRRTATRIPLVGGDGVWRTPVRGAFEPPSSYWPEFGNPGKVPAFALAVGVREMETFCLRSSVVPHQVEWYLRVARLLGLEPVTAAMQANRSKLQGEAFRAVIDAWSAEAPELPQRVERALALGLYEVHMPLVVRGARFWPRKILRDLAPASSTAR